MVTGVLALDRDPVGDWKDDANERLASVVAARGFSGARLRVSQRVYGTRRPLDLFAIRLEKGLVRLRKLELYLFRVSAFDVIKQVPFRQTQWVKTNEASLPSKPSNQSV